MKSQKATKLGQRPILVTPNAPVTTCPPGSFMAANGQCSWPGTIKLFRPESVFRAAPRRGPF